MRERDTLLSTLPEGVRDDAEKLIGEEAAPDPHEVVAELRRRGLLKDDQVRDAVLALEASLRVGRMRTRPPASASPSILGPLGAGAFGEVLLAKDAGLNRVVAVKRLHANMASKKSVVERFYKEAQVTAQLDHPGIVPIHGLVQTEDGGLAYAMKLVRGRTLQDYLDEAREQWRKHGREDAEHGLQARLEIFLHVCDAIGYAHTRGVVHRDLKPENLMVGQFGQVMVMDWGIAKVLDTGPEAVAEEAGAPPTKTHATRVGMIMGTPKYMSPEQAEGKNDILDARSDQYALGLILFEVVTLRSAVSEDLDLEGCLQWAAQGRKQAMTHVSRGGSVPRELVAIVDKATTRDRERRYATVSDLGNDVRRYLRDEAVLAKPDSLLQRLFRWVGRHRQLMVTLLMASVVALVVVTSTLLLLGAGALEWRRRAAAASEARLTAFLGEVTAGGAKVDAQARLVESVTTGLSFAAEASLDRPESDLGLHYDPVAEGAPRSRRSEFYGREVSAERPSFAVAQGTTPEELRTDIERLAVLGYGFARVLVDATGRGADQKLGRKQRLEVVTKDGSPVVWAHVATASGVLATYPGGPGAPAAGPDPRKLAWVTNAKTQGLAWSAPEIDDLGQGAVMTVSLPMWGRSQDFVGVAATELSLDALSELLVPPAGAREVFLMDGAGRKVVWPKMGAHAMKAYEPAKVEPGLVAAIKMDGEGWREAGGTLYAWTRVPSLGWTWVAVADSSSVH